MPALAAVLLLCTLAGCGTGQTGSRSEPTCYSSHDGSYTPATVQPDPLGTPGPCVEPGDSGAAYDSTLEVEWDDHE